MTKHTSPDKFKPRVSAAQRRRWQQDILRFTHACAGVLESYIVPARDHDRLTLLATNEPTAIALAHAIELWRRQVLQFGTRAPCLDCDTVFGPDLQPAAYAVTLPFADRGHALVTGVCGSCAAGKDLQRVMRELLRQIWPNAYNITGGGHG